MQFNFNPRTSYEVRQLAGTEADAFVEFQSTHLLRGATPASQVSNVRYTFQSTHLLRGATCVFLCSHDYSSSFQSTHLLRGATHKIRHAKSFIFHFNPRTSYEVRRIPASGRASWSGFQSTHLLRGATIGLIQSISTRVFQSTHLLRGATRIEIAENALPMISIHAPLTRCDSTCP